MLTPWSSVAIIRDRISTCTSLRPVIDGQQHVRWIADHYFQDATTECRFDAIFLQTRRHPRAIRTMELADHCDEIWSSATPEPYPKLEEYVGMSILTSTLTTMCTDKPIGLASSRGVKFGLDLRPDCYNSRRTIRKDSMDIQTIVSDLKVERNRIDQRS